MTTFHIAHKFNNHFDAGEVFNTLKDACNWSIGPAEKYTADDLTVEEFDDNGNHVKSHAF